MKTAIVGCGALGSYYGARLSRGGAEVHFLLRSEYDAVRAHGLHIQSPSGDFSVSPRCANDPAQIGPCDLVVVALKTTANHRFADLIAPLLHRQTMVLTLQNGLGNEAQLAALFGAERVLGGLCFVCLNRVRPGVVHHLAHGHIVMGEWGRSPATRTRGLADLFVRSGVRCEVTDDLDRAHWEKLVWNVPFNGLGVAGCAGYDAVVAGQLDRSCPLGPVMPTDGLLDCGPWEGIVRALMGEVIEAGRGLGYPLAASLAEENLARTRSMGAYKASTLIDFERGTPLELESLFREPLRQARAAGVSVPRLEALVRLLGQLDPG